MKESNRLYLFPAFIFLTATISGAAAFTLAETSVLPLGCQPAGTPVTVTAVIGFPRQDLVSDTFPSAHDLVMTTGLSGSRWKPVLDLDGRQTRMAEENGGMLKIGGTYLSYPATQDLKVRITLTGTLPEGASPSKDFLRVQEIDMQGNVIATASIAMPEVPLAEPASAVLPTKVTTSRKLLPTPLPTAPPTQESPAGVLTGIIAAAAALVALRRQ